MGFPLIAAGLLLMASPSRSELSKLSLSKKVGVNGSAHSTYRGGSYCGPGWGFTYQDVLDGRIAKMPAAVDAIDEACKLHDYCYHENGYFTQGCNLVLTHDLVKVVTDPASSPQQRLDATLMAAVFFIESQTLDLGVMGVRKSRELLQELEQRLMQSAMTLEQAITKVLSRGR